MLLDCAELVPFLLGSSQICSIVLLISWVLTRPMVYTGRIYLGMKSSPTRETDEAIPNGS